MSSGTSFGFPNGTELLMRFGNIPRYLHTTEVGVKSQSPGEGTSISAGESTVTSIKTERLAITSTDYHNLENQRPQQPQREASQSNIDRLAVLATVASESMFGSDSVSSQFTPNMTAYISASSAQSEALQTLHLMNSNFTGYGNPSHTSNMVLVNTIDGGQSSPLGSSEQQQQHFTRFAIPSAVNQTSYSHTSHMAAIANTELGNQSSPAELYAKRSSSQGYSWGLGNEFSFMPSGHMGEENQEIHINLTKTGQFSTHDMSHFGMGSTTPSLYHEQTPLFANSIAAAQSVNMDNLRQAHSNGGHILSLSLSPQQPSVMQQLHSFPMQQNESTANLFHGLVTARSDSLSNEVMPLSSKCAANSVGGSFPIPTGENMLGSGSHVQLISSNNRHGDFSGHLTIGSYGSKYLKPAKELLNEIVSVGQDLRANAFKQSKLQSWAMCPPSSSSDGSLMKIVNAVEFPSKVLISWDGGKEAEPVGTAMASIRNPGNPENAGGTVVELSSIDRQELQEKRAKLVGMRDEVDRRYKQYYHQMQAVTTSFETVAGLGAAAAYTALALQTISKHFCCLRDAISGQIQDTYKALGEKEISGITRGESSKLRRLDQQLQQQRALRQFGMMQQQAWRPQRGLPEHSVSILRAWLFEHFLHPYPKDADKIMLAKQTGLNRNQVSNWFINARVRLWKPMVEEMYLDELKEADAERAHKLGGSNKGPGMEGEREGMDGEWTSSEFAKPFKHAKSSGDNGHGFGDMKGTSSYPSDVHQSKVLNGPINDHTLHEEKGIVQQGCAELRPVTEDVSSFLGVDSKTVKANMDCNVDGENKTSRPDDNFKELYGVAPHNGFVQADPMTLTGYGSYQLHGMSRYGQENLGGGTGYAASGGVSLTLGLQHCEEITFSGGQQHYTAQAVAPGLLTSRQEHDVASADYYDVNESGSYEIMGLQSRKPYPAHMLCHDFVV